ncbi:MAG: hydroxylamine reductase [Candidatus Omnitrophica bacterium]|nr:hydroxylamine reductase [Candidatus Omnitrophota bacterium]
MFCRQCEQTFRLKGCEDQGVCGKSPDVANLQDALIHVLKAVAFLEWELRLKNQGNPNYDFKMMEGVFATLTNVNFDCEAIEDMIRNAARARDQLKLKWMKTYSGQESRLPKEVNWQPASKLTDLTTQGIVVGLHGAAVLSEDQKSLREILLYGIKGMAAYAHHAYRVGQNDPEVTGFLYKAMASLADIDLTVEELLPLVLECGKANLRCLEILDRGHTARFGHPEPTAVKIGHRKGTAIIVSGHELFDLETLLEQTKGKGINIYTHGEMLPALAYPQLKKYDHLVGHFGTAWQNQQAEFEGLPVAILMTTNCIQEPKPSYADRIFTTGAVGWPDVGHIEEINGKKDFTPVIQKALALGGFQDEKIEKEITIGFAHKTLMSHAGEIVEAVKKGTIKRFFLIGGCDGARPGRNYFTNFAESVPDDCLILTLACGKNRINRLDYPTVAGFPKLLDCGQCNDAYSAIVVAKALSEAFQCGINDLPLSMIISWYEQKAVAVLLTLLYLGVKNIRLGPSLPAFISPNVLNLLVKNYDIKPVKTAKEDLEEILKTGK